ncbi:MAG: efflux RND transporter periplasmic adaptor subunit [Acidobacteria bacterium]|nr:efflux RND transporter periplasmic adaptor subunit [Acidobacteriota bacterium]
MDRPIDSQYKIKYIAKKLIGTILIISIVIGAFSFAWFWLSPSIKRVRIRTAQVSRGAIEATVTASGKVIPEFEQVISSPIDARVLNILKHAGDKVLKNEPIIELDTNASILALEKINQELSLRENRQEKTLLSLNEKVDQIKSQEKLKQLDLESLKAQVKQNRKLFEQGLLPENIYRQSELLERKTAIELEQLEAAKKNAEEASKAEIAGLDLEISTLKKEQDEARRLLELATTRADRDGVLTWVVLEVGTTIHKGDVIARIADLKSYRIEASISDIHAKNLSIGQNVKVKINEDYLNGILANILPTIKDGVMTLAITLEDKTSSLLRPNLRTDVLIITSKKNSVLQIKKGPFANGDGKQEAFIIRGDTAIKMPVTIGIASFDTYEIIEGLLEGDEVIISDMRDYIHLKEIKVN